MCTFKPRKSVDTIKQLVLNNKMSAFSRSFSGLGFNASFLRYDLFFTELSRVSGKVIAKWAFTESYDVSDVLPCLDTVSGWKWENGIILVRCVFFLVKVDYVGYFIPRWRSSSAFSVSHSHIANVNHQDDEDIRSRKGESWTSPCQISITAKIQHAWVRFCVARRSRRPSPLSVGAAELVIDVVRVARPSYPTNVWNRWTERHTFIIASLESTADLVA